MTSAILGGHPRLQFRVDEVENDSDDGRRGGGREEVGWMMVGNKREKQREIETDREERKKMG